MRRPAKEVTLKERFYIRDHNLSASDLLLKPTLFLVQIKYSVMHPGIHVWPHCGPTNCRIRAHLGLVVPEGPKIRVATEYR